MLKVEIICSNEQQSTEDIGQLIKKRINGWFFTEDELTIAAAWIKAEPLEQTGIRLIFSVSKYPGQVTSADSPVALLNTWSVEKLPALLGEEPYMLGTAGLPAAFQPGEKTPAIYFRLAKVGQCGWIKGNNAADWRTAVVQGHIIVPAKPYREAEIVLLLDSALANEGWMATETFSMDVSKNNTVDLTQDPQRIGQLTIEAAYGIPKVKAVSDKLQNIAVKME